MSSILDRTVEMTDMELGELCRSKTHQWLADHVMNAHDLPEIVFPKVPERYVNKNDILHAGVYTHTVLNCDYHPSNYRCLHINYLEGVIHDGKFRLSAINWDSEIQFSISTRTFDAVMFTGAMKDNDIPFMWVIPLRHVGPSELDIHTIYWERGMIFIPQDKRIKVTQADASRGKVFRVSPTRFDEIRTRVLSRERKIDDVLAEYGIYKDDVAKLYGYIQ